MIKLGYEGKWATKYSDQRGNDLAESIPAGLRRLRNRRRKELSAMNSNALKALMAIPVLVLSLFLLACGGDTTAPPNTFPFRAA